MTSDDSEARVDPAALEAAFDEAIRCGEGVERAAFLDRLQSDAPTLAGLVRRYVEAAAKVSDLARDEKPGKGEPTNTSTTAELRSGARVAGFELVEVLGAGGFGVVWRARAASMDMPDVALKLLRPGMDSERALQRFQRERQLLARLEHSSIARVLEGGKSETGTPFIAMELVRGVPITQYARDHRLGAKGIAALLIQVCRAVEHAHGEGVLHRDLKASNVLIAEEDGAPLPKVIDFGIARLLDDAAAADTEESQGGITLTGEGHFVGSPTSMSPEQAGRTDKQGASLPVDALTDVFALGRLLFEMLTGTPAVVGVSGDRVSQLRILESVREMEAVSPRKRVLDATRRSTILANVPTDLDAVTLKATALERTKRYQTVAELRQELERFAQGQPVIARPPGGLERTGAFLRRHRVILVPAAIVVAVLTAGLVLLQESQRATETARVEAVDAGNRLELVVDAQTELIKELDVQRLARELRKGLEARVNTEDPAVARAVRALDATTVAREVLETSFLIPARRMAERAFKDDPESEARLLSTMSELQRDLGLFEGAREMAERALALREATLGPTAPLTLRSKFSLAATLRGLGRLDEAQAMYQATLDGWHERVPAGHLDTLDARIGLGLIAFMREDLDRAADILEGVRSIVDAAPENRTRSAGFALNNLGSVYERLLRLDEALEAYEAGRAIIRETLGEDSESLPSFDANIGRVLLGLGRIDEGETRLRAASEVIVERYGDEHPLSVSANSTLAALQHAKQLYDDAVLFAERAYEGSSRMRGTAHPDTLRQHANLATILLDGGRVEESVATSQAALTLAREHLPSPHVVIGGLLMERARGLRMQDRFDEAIEAALEGHTQLEGAIGASHPRTQAAQATLAAIYGAWDEAAPGKGHGEEAKRWGVE